MKKEKFIVEELSAKDQWSTFRHWARLTVFNLLLVAGAGLLLRIKIIFPLPVVDHKNLLHGHSHLHLAGGYRWPCLRQSLRLFPGIPGSGCQRTAVYFGLDNWQLLACCSPSLSWGRSLHDVNLTGELHDAFTRR